MSFLAPWAFLLSLLLPVIVALYLLKLRRTEREVPSVYLWRRMVRDVEANAPWQRLRANLLLILQLLFLLALILSLARPFTWTSGVGGQALILTLDTSASMSATDTQPTRLEAAKDQALSLVDSLPEGARLTVIAAGDKAQVMLASSQDRRQARLAIERIRPGAGGANLSVALELASAIAARQPDAEIVVLSDGRVGLPEQMVVKGRLRYLPIGISGENQAISLLSLEAGAAPGSLTAFTQVTNYGAQPAQRRLVLSADGQVVNAYDLDLPPGGQRVVLVEDLPAGLGQVEAHLEGADILAEDDRAVAAPPSGEPVPVTLVTQGNRFLETALSLLPGIAVTQALPGPEIAFPEAGLTIFDAYVPVTATLPAGNLLFIAPPRSTAYFTATGTLEAPRMRPAAVEDPLLEHISLADVSLLDAVRIPLPEWGRPVILAEAGDEATAFPLLFTGEIEGRRLAVLAFDLRRSDLPLQVAFPLLWANLIHWLAPGSAGTIPPQVVPGESISFLLPGNTGPVEVLQPDGSSQRLTPDAGRYVFADTGQLGLYRVRWGEGESQQETQFAVNLFLPQESSLSPAETLPGLGASGGGDGSEQGQGKREWWRFLALLALGLITVEWAVYQRAGLVRLRDDLRKVWKKVALP